MKRFVLILFLLFVILCNISKTNVSNAYSPPKKVNMDTAFFLEGQQLFKQYCAECHTIRQGRKKIVPDFNEKQLSSYTLQTSNARHKRRLKDAPLTKDVLGRIVYYLSNKERSGVEFKDDDD